VESVTRALGLALLIALPMCGSPAFAQTPGRPGTLEQLRFSTVPELHPGALEIGVSAALERVESTTASTIALRAARFMAAGNGRAAFEAELAHRHLGPLDELEFSGSVGWLAHPSAAPIYPFLALAAGVRQEWLGSFRLARYPVGVNVGMRVLAGAGALFRFEYRYRRVLDDPIADFTEHQLMSGLSLLFGNRP
jgi:hypothetical protein